MQTQVVKETVLLNSEQMIKKAGLDWKVKQSPVEYATDEMVVKQFPKKVVNFREDTGEGLGIVGSTYKVVQNSTAFAFLDSFLGESIENFVKAGSYRGGAVVYIRVKLPGTLIFAGNESDVGEKYVDFKTSHDGSICLSTQLVAFRLICSNGLMGFKKLAGASRKHTPSLQLDSIKEAFGLMNNQFTLIEELSRKMAATTFDPSNFNKVLEEIQMIPIQAKRTTRSQNILDSVTSLFIGSGKGANLAGSATTRWGAYNAITEYVDHYRWKPETREESAFIGAGAAMKQKALEVLSR